MSWSGGGGGWSMLFSLWREEYVPERRGKFHVGGRTTTTTTILESFDIELIHEILDWRYVNELVAHQRTRWDDN
jgi:hypothetical protein